MHWTIKTLLFGLIFLGGLLVASPAHADTTTSNAYANNNDIGASISSGPDPSPAASGGNTPPKEECTTKPINPRIEGIFMVGDDGQVRSVYDEEHKPEEGSWHRRVCYVGPRQTAYNVFWVANVDATDLARQALATAPLPSPVISLRPDIPLITLTNYPEWLWIQPDAWQTVTASATLDGLTATVTAVPFQVMWDSGDPRATSDERYIKCNGPGKALPTNPSYMDRLEDSGCTYFYRHTSGKEPDLTFDLSATIHWRVTWTATNGTSGNLGTVSRTSAIPVKVGEHQVINVSPREDRSR